MQHSTVFMNHAPLTLHLNSWNFTLQRRSYGVRPFFLLVHSDHRLDPLGPNSGAEMATLNQARFLAKAGHRIVVAGHLATPVATDQGVEFWDVGPSYDVEDALNRADTIGPYYLISAGRAVALILARRRANCLKRLLITHDRCAGDSGIKPDVLPYLVDHILCVSHAQKEKLISEGAPGEKMIVVHNGVDFDIFSPTPPIAHNPKRLVFSGALVPDKGLHLLINSFLDLRTKHSGLSLEIFGSASLWSRTDYLDVESLAKSIPRLIFRGKQPQLEISRGFQRAGICVVPSIWFDPYPLTSLEAQACGCPVVAFNMGGLPEGIQNGVTGIVVDPVDQAALTSALDSLLQDPLRLGQMSASCAQFASTHFRWERVVEFITSLCEEQGGGGTEIIETDSAITAKKQLSYYLNDEPSDDSQLREVSTRATLAGLLDDRDR
jgi:glycosyltransferase involved in cell wall biosynthesis